MSNETPFEEMTPEQQQEVTDRESEQALADGYATVAGTEKPDAKPEPKEENEPPETEPAAEKETKEEDEFTEDPWAGVPQVVRDSLQQLSSIPTQIRKLQGQFGTLNRDIKEAQTAARQQTHAAGSQAPTQAEIDEAAKNEQAWKELEEGYPEWASALGGQMKLLEKRLESRIPNVNLDEFGNRILGAVEQRMQANNQVQREMGKLDIKHSDWENTINSDDYLNWFLQNGPTAEDFALYKEFEKSDPAKATAVLNEIIRLHPQWWSEKGSKWFSDHAKDAIDLLDAYTAPEAGERKPSGNPPPAPSANSRSERNSKRLERAAVPAGSHAPAPTGISDEEALNVGYKKVAAMRKF